MIINSNDAVLLQLAHDKVVYANIIREAEAIVAADERPRWLTRRINKIEKKIKTAIRRGKSTIFLFMISNWWVFGISRVKRMALGIVLCEKGYYVSTDIQSTYISWQMSFSPGKLVYNGSLSRSAGGDWNIDNIGLGPLYNSLGK